MLAVVSVGAQVNPRLDNKNGYKYIKLGSPIDSIHGFGPRFKGDSSSYAPLEFSTYDSLRIGEYPVREFRVGNYKGKAFEIAFFVPGNVFGPEVIKILSTAYGPPKRPNPKEHVYYWEGKNVHLKVEYGGKYDTVYVLFTEKNLDSKRRKEDDINRVKHNKKAAEDL